MAGAALAVQGNIWDSFMDNLWRPTYPGFMTQTAIVLFPCVLVRHGSWDGRRKREIGEEVVFPQLLFRFRFCQQVWFFSRDQHMTTTTLGDFEDGRHALMNDLWGVANTGFVTAHAIVFPPCVLVPCTVGDCGWKSVLLELSGGRRLRGNFTGRWDDRLLDDPRFFLLNRRWDRFLRCRLSPCWGHFSGCRWLLLVSFLRRDL